MAAITMIGEEVSLHALAIDEILEARIHARTGGRLRFLRVRAAGDRLYVWGAAPTYHVRQLAEQAALSLVPADCVQLEIDVLPVLRWHEPEFRRGEAL